MGGGGGYFPFEGPILPLSCLMDCMPPNFRVTDHRPLKSDIVNRILCTKVIQILQSAPYNEFNDFHTKKSENKHNI